MSKWTDEQAIRAHESAAGYDPETQRIMAGRRVLDLESELAAMRPVVERNGMLLAEKTINAKGGINGRPIKLVVEDDASNPDTALSKANDLLFSQKVVGLIGPSLTASTDRKSVV